MSNQKEQDSLLAHRAVVVHEGIQALLEQGWVLRCQHPLHSVRPAEHSQSVSTVVLPTTSRLRTDTLQSLHSTKERTDLTSAGMMRSSSWTSCAFSWLMWPPGQSLRICTHTMVDGFLPGNKLPATAHSCLRATCRHAPSGTSG
jgi:hypothetical protein